MAEQIINFIKNFELSDLSRDQKILFFFAIFTVAILLFELAKYFIIFLKGENLAKKPSHFLVKNEQNPALSPIAQFDWQGQGTCNPAAYMDDDGKVHILYRAIGNDGVSRLGYASSPDGFFFKDVHPYPVYSVDHPAQYGSNRSKVFSPTMYPSGGSWGGCEDPRMVAIDDRIYVSFSVFGGWDYIRVAVSSIKKEDFLAKKWNWSKPIHLSPAGQVNKNWMLFPEKIEGKFAILHSINPKVEIEYVDKLEDLESGAQNIKTSLGPRTNRPARKNWDSWPRGAGAPPVRTDKGWLLLYNATTKEESHKYKVGTMLLDINNPSIVIARAPSAILVPDEWYENDWKPGIVYVSGAVIKDDDLFVYYGGGDKHVCVAKTPLNKLLDWMIEHSAEEEGE